MMEYGCIGEHLTHSFSKEIHNALADYDYSLLELTRDDLPRFLNSRDFKAINVTIPYKKDVIPFLDWISPEAQEINAVNTIVNKNGKLYGYNTDYYGLKSLVERKGVSLKNKTIAVLGSGGTSNTACAVSKGMGAANILKVSRTSQVGYITYEKLYDISDGIDVIINTTPCGMFPDIGVSAVDITQFKNLTAVFDAVYNPLKSKLICDAKSRGIKSAGGLYMLVYQAAYAVEKFIGNSVDVSSVEKIYFDLYKSKMNIVLVGMPSCGKTTVGDLLSERLNKSLSDTDKLVEKKDGRKIVEIFEQNGEEFFRKLEREAISKSSKINSQIIATGGGAVLDKTNIDALSQNGRIYFIDRPFDLLIPTCDRPLSSNIENLKQRFNERYPIYCDCADVVIDGSGTPHEVAERIEADFYGYTCD